MDTIRPPKRSVHGQWLSPGVDNFGCNTATGGSNINSTAYSGSDALFGAAQLRAIRPPYAAVAFSLTGSRTRLAINERMMAGAR
jgi:hypothetical protein